MATMCRRSTACRARFGTRWSREGHSMPCPSIPMTVAPGRSFDIPLGHETCRLFDRLDDVPVAGAAAEVAAQVGLDLSPRRMRVLGEERFRCQDHAGGAEAALERTRA